MTKFVQYMSEHKWLNVILIIAYYIIVVAPHKRFGIFLNDVIFDGITRDQYNFYVLIAAIVLLTVYGLVFIINSIKRIERKKLWFYMIVNIILAALIFNMLFVINIEVIHFPQYAVFAILLFPLIGNYTATLVWATIGGMTDEAYQYFYLAPYDTSFYDLNDVVTNLIGAVFGLLLLRSLGITEHSKFSIQKSSIWYGLGAISATIIIAHLAGILSIYPSEERPFHLVRKWPPGFWSIVHPNVTYHIIRPIEGIAITVLLWGFYSKIRERE